MSSGQFCGTGTNYTLHFVALFDRPFTSARDVDSTGIAAGSDACTGTTCGRFVTFDTTTQRQVLMKVGISFVSTADALQNLRAEDPGWSLQRVSAQAPRRAGTPCSGASPCAVARGRAAHLLHGALPLAALPQRRVGLSTATTTGSDGRVHTAHGRDEYANFSEWDIYRSEIQLEALARPP